MLYADGLQLPIVCHRDTKEVKICESSCNWEWLRNDNLRIGTEKGLIAAFLKDMENTKYSVCLLA